MSLITKFMFSLPVSASSSSTFLGHHWIDSSVGPRIDIVWYEWISDKPMKSTMIQWTTLSKYQSCIGILECHSCVWFLNYPQPNHKLKESHVPDLPYPHPSPWRWSSAWCSYPRSNKATAWCPVTRPDDSKAGIMINYRNYRISSYAEIRYDGSDKDQQIPWKFQVWPLHEPPEPRIQKQNPCLLHSRILEATTNEALHVEQGLQQHILWVYPTGRWDYDTVISGICMIHPKNIASLMMIHQWM